MGTGTDFKTSADIENKGGLVLVFGIKPTNTSTFEQLSCRVGRIFNKSRRFYIINDAAYVGPNQQYLKYQLKIIKQKENEDARALLYKLKLYNEDKYVKSGSSSEPNTDLEDEILNQFNHNQSQIDNNEQIYEEKLELESKQSQARTKDIQNEKIIKKRLQKEIYKIASRENKFFSHSKGFEECKFCGKQYIEPHFCQNDQTTFHPQTNARIIVPSQFESQQQTQDDIALDPNIFLNVNSHYGFFKAIPDQSSILYAKGSENCFSINHHSEYSEEFSPKFDQKLQKRKKDAKQTEFLEQRINKLLQNQELQAKTEQNKVQSESVDDMYFNSNSSNHEMNEEKTKRRSIRIQEKKIVDYNDLYFKSYEAYDIHEEMLNDQVRMNAFEKSILELCKGQIVIDVGAGTGILSILSAEAGASHVYGIEYTNIIEKAKDKVSQSDYRDRITLIKGNAEDVSLGQVKADVIVSEWMGYFLLFENMLPSVLKIRDKYLKEDGTMVPKRTSIHFGVMSKQCNERENFMYRAMVDECEQQYLKSTSHQIFLFDLESDKLYDQKGFTSAFELIMLEDCLMTGFVAWFDAVMTENILLSTSPHHPLTHWKQTLFYLPYGIEVQKDSKIAVKVIVGHQKENPRALWFTISYKAQGMKKSKSLSYLMN